MDFLKSTKGGTLWIGRGSNPWGGGGGLRPPPSLNPPLCVLMIFFGSTEACSSIVRFVTASGNGNLRAARVLCQTNSFFFSLNLNVNVTLAITEFSAKSKRIYAGRIHARMQMRVQRSLMTTFGQQHIIVRVYPGGKEKIVPRRLTFARNRKSRVMGTESVKTFKTTSGVIAPQVGPCLEY